MDFEENIYDPYESRIRKAKVKQVAKQVGEDTRKILNEATSPEHIYRLEKPVPGGIEGTEFGASPEHQEKPTEIEFANLKYEIGQLLYKKFIQYNEGKFHTGIELNPATHAITELMFDKLSSLRAENEALREERDKAIAIVKSLADWSRRYPRDRVYPMNKISMDNELIELEERAKAYTLNTLKS